MKREGGGMKGKYIGEEERIKRGKVDREEAKREEVVKERYIRVGEEERIGEERRERVSI